MFNNILHCMYKCKLFSRLPDVRYCTAYYNIETCISLQYRLLIKTMTNQYIKVNESYRIIIPSFHLTFPFLISQKYLSIVIVV